MLNHINNITTIYGLFSFLLSKFLLFELMAVFANSVEQSFYDLLGVPPNAGAETIRKAFKKIALSKHPDRNQDDPDAHENFLRYNRAYEVLKDEELRREYDQYGEKGLSDSMNTNFHSWRYYRDNFGIYDDDDEITTLSRSDFDEEVFASGELWFINFYSAFCSHCHELSPVWREFGKEMSNIIRIGAVNCAEDPFLCNSQGVNAYPTLLLYPSRTFYQGRRDLRHLLQFIIAQLTAPVYYINPARITQFGIKRPLILEFCTENVNEDENYCFSQEDRKKIAAMVFEFADFGVTDCSDAEGGEICRRFDKTRGLWYFATGTLAVGLGKEIGPCDSVKDIKNEIIKHLPTLNFLTTEDFERIVEHNNLGSQETEILILFFEKLTNELLEQPPLIEFKILPFIFPNLPIYFIDCNHIGIEKCNEFNVEKSKVILFRHSGGIDYSSNMILNLREVIKFTQASLSSTLIYFTSEKYYDVIDLGLSDNIWLIDYFAPWCPPCLKLTKELRKLPVEIEGRKINVGALNCQNYNEICQEKGIKSYPKSVLYANGNTFELVGYHSIEHIVEFITESLHPSLLLLDPNYIEDILSDIEGDRSNNEPFYFIHFYTQSTQNILQEFRRLAREFPRASPTTEVLFGSFDCDKYAWFCNKENINWFPTTRLYGGKPNQPRKDYPSNWWHDRQTMAHWLNENLPSLVERITDDFVGSILRSPLPYIVDFYAPWCGHCVNFAPVFERVAKILEGKVRAAKIDCDFTPFNCQWANIREYPSLRLYTGANEGKQDPSGKYIRHTSNPETIAEVILKSLEAIDTSERRWTDEL